MSSPQSRGARRRSTMTKQQEKGLTIPINFCLSASDTDLDNFELARLAEQSDCTAQAYEFLERAIDCAAQAGVIRWFRSQGRQALKHAIENEETAEEWAKRMIRDRQRSPEELLPLPSLPPGAAHLAAAQRYTSRNLAEGKCSVCPEPLDRNFVRFCTKNLAMQRDRERQKKGLSDPGSREYLYAGDIPESTHGRQSGTLASLAKNREKATREVLAELGLPLSSAVSLPAAKEALLRVIRIPRPRP